MNRKLYEARQDLLDARDAYRRACRKVDMLSEDDETSGGIRFVNCTPHDINLNDGRVIPASGNVARVTQRFSDFDENGICRAIYGDVVGVPSPAPNTLYIVSAMVMDASDRNDLVAPATGHPECVRSEDRSRILSVPGFIRKAN